MFRKAVHKNESGVALLFALGILSLLLVLGLAFASNALLAQKVASNNSNRSQAKLLAQSAISRIATAIMYYQFQAANWSPAIIPVDYSDIYSYGKDKNNKVFADGLFSKDDSLLTPPSSASTEQLTTETFQKPKWAFIFDKPEDETNRKIVGRIAYQQVPGSNGASKITMDSVLRGVYKQKSHATSSTSETENHEPWKYRWGKTISELNFNTSTPLNNWNSNKPAESALTETTFSSIPAFFTAYGTEYFSGEYADEKKAFFERWFTGGTEPVEPEFYRYETVANGVTTEYKLYHRFNLGDIDKCDLKEDQWYDRFRNDTSVTLSQNSTAILDKLAGSSAEFKLTDELTPADTGIPFLKLIANEPETFSTLEARRKQIAANLNDYCDPDSIPTSDFPATKWSVEEGVTEPTFTGNERTPYIYELGYKLEIYHQADGATKTKGFEVDVTNKKLGFQLALFPAVKLAQIYENIPDDFQKFIFKNSVKEISLKGEIIEATYNGIKYKYENDKGNEVEASSPASGTIKVADVTDKEIKFEPKWSITPSTETGELLLNKPNDADNNISFNLPLNSYPFGEAKDSNNWHGEKYQIGVTGLFDEETLKRVVKLTTPHDPTTIVSGPTSITVNKVEITRIAVKRGPLLLLGTYSDGKGGSSTFGVDYVRSPSSALESTETITFSNSPSDKEDSSFKFLLGGIRGIDPRQNLNENDWFVASRITQGDSKWEKVMCVSSNASGAITGEANKKLDSEADPSHPSPPPFDPGAATDTSKYDTERKASNNGPAWGDDSNHLSTAYIRNAPMQSLWELGVIHRGAAWQTLNLKAAGAPKDPSSPAAATSISPADMKQNLAWSNAEGTSYASGDGGILEQVKLTENAYCYGKIDINMLCSDTSINKGYQSKYDDEMGQVLFNNIRYGQEISKFETDTATGSTLSFSSGSPLSQVVTAMTSSDKRPFASRTQFLDWTTGGNSLANAFGAATLTSASDAQLEEIVGKTINLLKAEPSASNVIQFIVVAQTIRDLSGTITRIRPDDNTPVTRKNCAYGQFDVARYYESINNKKIDTDSDGDIKNDGHDESNPETMPSTDPSLNQSPDDYLYFDEITGEVKMLVTLEKVSEITGQLIVTSIEYID